MIVARVASAAEAILAEFKNTGIMALLDRAINISASRQNIQDQQWPNEATAIRNDAKKIIDGDILRTFPGDMASLLKSSGYSAAFPGNIARVIYNGMTNVKTTTMSSSELQIYQAHANTLQSELGAMLNAFRSLKFDRIKVPEGKISIDILIPRDTAEDDIYYFIKVNNAFAEIISSFEQLVGLPKEPPKLVYSSTTDLVTGLTIAVLALTPFLDFYNKLLDAAKKHIDILQGLKSLRSLPLQIKGEQDFNEQIEESRKKYIEEAVENAVKKIDPPPTDMAAAAELSNNINIRSKVIVNAITNGARVGITVESLVSLPQTLNDSGVDYEAIKLLIEANAKLGSSVKESLKLFGEPVPLALTDETPKGAVENNHDEPGG
jgi:hypothetical protein